MKNKPFMPFNLQFFSEDGGHDNPGTQSSTEFNVDEVSEEQLAVIKEKYGLKDDKDVDSIIKSKRARWKKETEDRENEAARLAKLSEEERQQALFDKEREDFEKEKAEFLQTQLFVEKGKQLTEQGMPADFASRINGETAEEILEDVKAFRKEWDKAVENKVNERLASKTKTRVGNSTGQLSKAEIMKIKDTNERQRLIAENRDLF